MIISASYRTDIPTFYGEWFMNRLDAGYCMVRNPYGARPYRVELGRDYVDGFVFWTKNLGPFLDRLALVHARDYAFVVQYTINGYPRELESSVVDAARSVEHMRILADRYGARVPVWRYDPVLVTSLTPLDFHRANFARLAAALAGTTDEVVVAFANIYAKTQRNLNAAARHFGLWWRTPSEQEKRDLLRDMVDIAHAHGMRLTMCSQPDHGVAGVETGRCVDAARLSDVAGYTIRAALKGNRPECGCYYSRDIGAYDTCPHGCVYCYAVEQRAAARRNYRAHDPGGDYLDHGAVIELPELESRQLRLL